MKPTDETDIAAMQFVLMAMIDSHPDKRALLGHFDRLFSEQQMAILPIMGRSYPEGLKRAVEAYRDHIEKSMR